MLDEVVNGKGTHQERAFLKPLIVALAENLICFGDGPRWNFVYISMTVGGWLKHIDAKSLKKASSVSF